MPVRSGPIAVRVPKLADGPWKLSGQGSQRSMLTFTYTQSLHEKALDEIFEITDVDGSAPPVNCVLIAFVNRSGSNYLAELLLSTGMFSGLEESINDHTMRYLARAKEIKSFQKYLEFLYESQTKNAGQFWGMKVGWMQLAMLLRVKAIPNALRPHVILIKRRDIIGQTISYYIAERTKQWTSNDEAMVNRNDIEYNGQAILQSMRSIMNSYSLMDQILALSNLPVIQIAYEDLLDVPHATISKITRSICGHEYSPRVGQIRINMQRDGINERLRDNFIRDLGRLKWEALPHHNLA